ncbi:MAG: alcohol dehydrogenase catalytic domain-containing protein, partial [Alphaproteobacteria bacterium]|nr:alcohol dehydrogenase catalytic domain-containing protein [Alphaproteobacteria bacterium]
MTQIKAAVCHAHGTPLQIEAVNLRAPGMGEVEVTLKACAICHSDIHFAEGAWGGKLPAIFGHEAAGHVTAIGEGIRGVAVGDPVVVTLIRACGTCATCGGGMPVLCATPPRYDGPLTTLDGGPIVQAMDSGAFAERVVVDQSQIVKLPADMDMVAASLLACGVITGVGAVVNAAGLRAGQDVVVIGAGGVGLNAIQG